MQELEKTWNFDENDWVDRYDKVVADETGMYERYSEVLDTVLQRARVGGGMRVLDIGTGTGNLALRCVAKGASVVGLDPSERMLAGARRKAESIPDVDFQRVEDPFLNIPFPDASFDAIVTTYAFHHIPHRLKPDSVREMVRVLKPGAGWALGDLAFESQEAERRALQKGLLGEEEYFARVEELRPVFANLDTELYAEQFTPVTWVFWATVAGAQNAH